MLVQDKSTTYTYTTGDGFYYDIKVYDNGLVECYITHEKIYLLMFMYCYHLKRDRSLNNIIQQVGKDALKYQEYYKSFVKNSRLHYMTF